MQLTLNLKMTTAQVVEKRSVTVNNNSFIQDCAQQGDHIQPTSYNYYSWLLFNFLKLICNVFYC